MIVSVNQTAAGRLDSLPAPFFYCANGKVPVCPSCKFSSRSLRARARYYIILYFTPLSFTILYSSLLYFVADCQYFSQRCQHLNEKRQQLHQKM